MRNKKKLVYVSFKFFLASRIASFSTKQRKFNSCIAFGERINLSFRFLFMSCKKRIWRGCTNGSNWCGRYAFYSWNDLTKTIGGWRASCMVTLLIWWFSHWWHHLEQRWYAIWREKLLIISVFYLQCKNYIVKTRIRAFFFQSQTDTHGLAFDGLKPLCLYCKLLLQF